jgi:hypothetical protein
VTLALLFKPSTTPLDGGFRFGQLAKPGAAREDESATRADKARWKVFGSSRCVAMHNSGARPRI